MKKLLLSITAIFTLSLNSQSNFTWVGGSNISNNLGSYGTQGVSNATNQPEARQGAANWIDASNNLWLFGGNTQAGRKNDLWKFNTTTNQWVWLKGPNTINDQGVKGVKSVSSSLNNPSARDLASTWVDANGNLWLFGGNGTPINGGTVGSLNDLWKYNPTLNEWTWMNGDSLKEINGIYGTQGNFSGTNKPGARYAAASWFDNSGNLFLFGGAGFGQLGGGPSSLNDLWKYNIGANAWAWVSGSNFTNQYGIYGTKGIASNLNVPGARNTPATWKDTNGNFYLFGGNGAANSSFGTLNDLWRFNLTSGQWTWMKGDSTENKNAIYGNLNVSSSLNIPGSRSQATSWFDANGNLYLFGGQGKKASGASNFSLNDIWKYDLTTNNWTWVQGDSIANKLGNYGTINISSPTNEMGARSRHNSWVESSGKVWIFGGQGYSSAGGNGNLNDLWSNSSVPTSLSKISNATNFTIYPNPTSSILNIEVKEQTQISIVNVLGDVVLTQTLNRLSKIDVSNLTSGVYFIQDSKTGQAIKFIKE